MTNKLIDTHCHLNMKGLRHDVDFFIKDAIDKGVSKIMCVGVDLKNLDAVKEIAEKNENVFYSVGVHPHYCGDEPITADELIELSKQSDNVKAIGESGLDFFRNLSAKEIQIKNFKEHIKASQETGLPLILHIREATEDSIKILQECYDEKPFRAVVHCFSGDRVLMDVCLELGFYISITGTVTYPKAKELRENIKDIPLDRLFVETDSPYLTPEPFRKKTNRPSNVILVAKELSKLRNQSYEEICEATTKNAEQFFNI